MSIIYVDSVEEYLNVLDERENYYIKLCSIYNDILKEYEKDKDHRILSSHIRNLDKAYLDMELIKFKED